MAKGRSPLVPVNGQQRQQTAAERRLLRGCYRELHSQALVGKENMLDGGADLKHLLANLETLHCKAERPREHAVDAEVFAQLTQCGLELIKEGQAVNQGRTPSDLVQTLRSSFVVDPMALHDGALGPGDIDWAGLGAIASELFRASTGVSCLLGPMEAQAKSRKPVVRQPKQAVEALTRPQEMEAIEEGDKQETDRNYESMWRNLCSAVADGQRVPLINLVCNHRSFAQTVENLFTLSFLVRDQRVHLVFDSDAGLMVQPVSEEHKASAVQQAPSGSMQFMLDFSMDDWRDMKQLVQVDSCLMPHRGQQQRAAAGSSRSRPAGEDLLQQQQQAKRARRG